MADKITEDIIDTIEGAIKAFDKKIPGLQDKVFDELQLLIKKFKTTSRGGILSNIENLKLIYGIKKHLEKIILNKDYVKAVESFIKSFDAVQALQLQYFSLFSQKYKPAKTLDLIKQISIEATVNSLLETGISSNVTDKVADILGQNVINGGSYSSLANQLRDHILTNNNGDGSLVRYSRQITTDALNEFSGRYHDAIAEDLDMKNWGRFIGSNLTTTREFCLLLTGKEWVHKSELPEVIKGKIDGIQCRIYERTGLPIGMKPGTNVNNFIGNRGGYSCGHQWFWVPDVVVPANIKQRIKT